VGVSYAAVKAVEAAALLREQGIDAEVIDLCSIKPWDTDLVINSVRRTGRLLVTDGGWRTGGIAAEIIATVAELALDSMVAPPVRVTLPDAPAPTSKFLERAYYFGAAEIVTAALELMRRTRTQAFDIVT
jgi:pyruvate dehydrogenase E1 component beta subunit